MKSVPAIVRNVSDERAVEMTLIENLQREDLNPSKKRWPSIASPTISA